MFEDAISTSDEYQRADPRTRQVAEQKSAISEAGAV